MNTFDTIAIEFDLTHHSIKHVALEELRINAQEENKIYWIHSNLNQADAFKQLVRKLRLPADVIQLCTEENNLSNLIDNDNALTLQIKCLASLELNEDNEISLDNLVIHLTPHYCFTAADKPLPVLFDFLNSCSKSVHYAKTPCFILFLFLEGIINDYAKVLFHYEEISEQFESLIQKTHQNIYKEVAEVKHQTLQIKRDMIAIREILMRITSRNILVISEKCRSSLYNLSNHSHLIINEVDSIRELLNGLLGQIDNELMQKISETMAVLAAFAAIFLPLNLITGIYGMNFEWMPELRWKYGYFGALGLIIVCAIFLYLLFKKKKWM
ncbi:magnesium transporter CorA family protein [Legionella anisa]|uniref:Magnesium transporter CorA family protein n=1 Tax=Legionella anisa TaxID=28082 RepID=A0AAX0WX24_9GAMM|nr:magnesium transporter CorA family protein [Legionella anisa]AWN72472.1 magnesium transporter CorA family protein [Legionella anisa]KTC72347.1 magnesium and cobalt transport protein CorA [Legionella anisa]MBN5935561.1 magnesium transporter CorA family protein [Legionella anisa]MCW8423236.1 magnesium transporter CorA family protein [Legionella anisa]MCW8446754.1 magnesium transporter CorA family protein [Legionella anisa]